MRNLLLLQTRGVCQPRPPVLLKSSDFLSLNVSSENCWAFAAGKDRCSEFYSKVFELYPLLYKFHDTSASADYVQSLI